MSICLVFCACSKKKSDGYQIGLDPTWYPLELSGREKNVLAFSIELLQEIAKKENIQLSIVSMSWNNLLWGLTEKKYDAILSSMYPYVFYQKKFIFSDLYLPTGPVVVVPLSSKIHTVNDLKGKLVGVIQGSVAALLLQKYPGIIVHSFDSIPETLNALENGNIEACVLNVLPAQNYVRDLYFNEVKIATDPLNDHGLRLISLYEKNQQLVQKFNRGFQEIKKNSRYTDFLKKWGLSPDSKPTAELDQKIDLFLKSAAL